MQNLQSNTELSNVNRKGGKKGTDSEYYSDL